MQARRAGRIAAMQILYQMDAQDGFDALDVVLHHHFEAMSGEETPEAREFAEQLCRGIVERLAEIDDLIARASQHWRLARMSRVDRNVLRLASYELAHVPEIPLGVAINEAVEIGKAFGATESASFINGVLDQVAKLTRDGPDPRTSHKRQ